MTAKTNVVFLLSGLSSSSIRAYQNWAKDLEARLKNDPLVRKTKTLYINVSSDGERENEGVNIITRLYRRGELGVVVTAGHSNGARDQLKLKNVPVDYVAVLDMTLGEFGMEAGSNIRSLDEFHAVLGRVNLSKDFNGTYKYFQVRNKFPYLFFHSRLGMTPKSFPEVYDRIFDMMKKALTKNG